MVGEVSSVSVNLKANSFKRKSVDGYIIKLSRAAVKQLIVIQLSVIKAKYISQDNKVIKGNIRAKVGVKFW